MAEYAGSRYAGDFYIGPLIRGSIASAIPVASQGYWKSSPQPIADAVVNLYLDIRDIYENPQLFDTLTMEPLFSGQRMNIYYSSDDTIATSFVVSRNYELLQPPYANITLPTQDSTTIQGLDFGINQYVSASNTIVSMLPLTNSWTIGLEVTTTTSSNNYGLASIITSDHFVDLWIEGGSSLLVFSVYPTSGNELGYCTVPYTNTGTNTIVFGWNSVTSTYSCYVNGIAQVVTTSGTVTPPSSPIQTINIGTVTEPGSFQASGCYISHPWIRQQAPLQQVVSQYNASTSGFIDAKGTVDVTNGSYNTLLLGRFTSNTAAFVGPSADWFTAKIWTPLQRDFSLQKGTYQVPPVFAKYLKFEISDLTAQPYLFDGDYITRTVQLFPDWVVSYYQSVQNAIANNTAGIYQSFNASNVSPSTAYNTIPTTTLFGAAQSWLTGGNKNPSLLYQNQSSLGSYSWIYPNTTTLVKDPTLSINTLDQTGTQDNLFNNDNNSESWLYPRFPFVGTHQYKYITLNQTWKQAYFTGIMSINIYLSNPSVPINTAEYFESCLNTSNIIQSNTLSYQPNVGFLCTTPGQSLTTYSLESVTPINAVQVAGVTSDWESQFGSIVDSEQYILANQNFVPEYWEIYPNTSYVTSTPQWPGPSNLYQVLPISPTWTGTYPGYGVQTIPSAGSAGSNLLTSDDSFFSNDSVGFKTNSNWKAISNIITMGSPSGIPVAFPTEYPSTPSLQLAPISSSSGYSSLATQMLGTAPMPTGSPGSGAPGGNMVLGLNYYNGTPATLYSVISNYDSAQPAYGEQMYGSENQGAYIPATYEWMVSLLNNTDLTGRTIVLEMFYYASDGATVLKTYSQSYTENNTMTWPSTPFTVSGPTVAGAAYTGLLVTVEGIAAEVHNLNYAGLFLIPQGASLVEVWTAPEIYINRRISAAGRVYIPRHAGQYGTYIIELLSGGTPIASKTYQGIPNTYIDLEVVFINTAGASPNSFSARIRQSNDTVIENFYVEMLGVFFHPIQWSISFFDSISAQWTTPKILASVINNANGTVVPNTISGTATQLKLTLTAFAHGATISSFVLKPLYQQSPLTNLASINTYPNPFVNEIGSSRGTSYHPHFRLWDNYYPQIYSQQYINYISNQAN